MPVINRDDTVVIVILDPYIAWPCGGHMRMEYVVGFLPNPIKSIGIDDANGPANKPAAGYIVQRVSIVVKQSNIYNFIFGVSKISVGSPGEVIALHIDGR